MTGDVRRRKGGGLDLTMPETGLSAKSESKDLKVRGCESGARCTGLGALGGLGGLGALGGILSALGVTGAAAAPPFEGRVGCEVLRRIL